jgi:hypothetical protein
VQASCTRSSASGADRLKLRANRRSRGKSPIISVLNVSEVVTLVSYLSAGLQSRLVQWRLFQPDSLRRLAHSVSLRVSNISVAVAIRLSTERNAAVEAHEA